MLRALRPRITYANVIATLALFLALGGAAYARLSITGADVVKHSLTGANIANHTLTGRNIKRHSVTGADIKGLTRADFKGDHILSAAGQGSLLSKSGKIEIDGTLGLDVRCPKGQVATGGGFTLHNVRSNDAVKTLLPTRNAYTLFVTGTPGDDATVYAVCEQ